MSAAMRFVLGMPDEASEAAELGLAEQMARVERALLIAALSRQNGRASRGRQGAEAAAQDLLRQAGPLRDSPRGLSALSLCGISHSAPNHLCGIPHNLRCRGRRARWGALPIRESLKE